MPQELEDYYTDEILDIADGTNTETEYTVEECLEELKKRLWPSDHPNAEMARGIRPTKPNL